MKLTSIRLTSYFVLAASLILLGVQHRVIAEEAGDHPFGERSIFSDRATEQRIKHDAQHCMQGEDCAGSAGNTGQAAGATVALSAEEIYNSKCMTCHAAGVAGAPLIDDKAAWTARLDEKGLEQIIQNAIKGINAMPAMGLCMECSEEDIKKTVEFMLAEFI